ncbi:MULTISPECIES: FkbM family methyltransferase [unclassified Caballeronia]|uniref:FkbM family methyltransferase n=1 Tax=unclassified Caballeronia TaxID=2646786 RepID=UPI0020293AC7|nr:MULTISPECIES: FkbM family methyltransferase [unclassified Caballeronia]
MRLAQITPFRQAIKVYSILIGIGDDLRHLSNLRDGLTSIEHSIDRLTQVMTPLAPVTAPKHEVDIHEINGFRLLLDDSSIVDHMVIHTGEWEGATVRRLMQLAEVFRGKRDAVFLDLGSYWGYYTLMMHSTGIFPVIHSVDADRYNFAQLQANIFLNKLDDVVTAHHGAISDAPGVLMMQSSHSHADKNRGATRIVSADEQNMTARPVKAFAVDDVFHFEGAHIVIKMDVEGHEDKALLGMRNLVANNHVILQIEIYEEQKDRVLPVIGELGLRLIDEKYPDFFFTNLPANVICG